LGKLRIGPRGKLAIKALVGVVVVAAVARQLGRAWGELRHDGEALTAIDPPWIVAAIALYGVGLTLQGVVFARLLDRSATPIPRFQAIRAYLISHLGKYVPGKALVVVMRAGLAAGAGARPATAVLATFYETLAMMAAGGLIAAIGFAIDGGGAIDLPWGEGRRVPLPLWALGLAIGAGFFVVVLPTVFPRVAGLFRAPFPGVGPEALPRLSSGLLVEAMAWSTGGWLLLGLSLVAMTRGVGGVGLPVDRWPVAVASVALATAAGFAVAIFPGGLVVREGVLMAAMAPAIGSTRAAVAAVALRLAWVVGELVMAAALAPFGPRAIATTGPSPP